MRQYINTCDTHFAHSIAYSTATLEYVVNTEHTVPPHDPPSTKHTHITNYDTSPPAHLKLDDLIAQHDGPVNEVDAEAEGAARQRGCVHRVRVGDALPPFPTLELADQDGRLATRPGLAQDKDRELHVVLGLEQAPHGGAERRPGLHGRAPDREVRDAEVAVAVAEDDEPLGRGAPKVVEPRLAEEAGAREVGELEEAKDQRDEVPRQRHGHRRRVATTAVAVARTAAHPRAAVGRGAQRAEGHVVLLQPPVLGDQLGGDLDGLAELGVQAVEEVVRLGPLEGGASEVRGGVQRRLQRAELHRHIVHGLGQDLGRRRRREAGGLAASGLRAAVRSRAGVG